MRLRRLLLVALFAAAPAAAQTHTNPNTDTDTDPNPNTRTATPKPLWEAGLFGFGVSQTAYPGAAERVGRGFVLPYLIYRGKFLRVDDNTVGVRALKTPTTELDIGFSGSFGASSNDVKVREGMPSLGTLFEFGPRLKVNLSERVQLKLPLRAVFDVSNQFRGRGAAFEPELSAGWRLTPATRLTTEVSLIVGDRRLNDHLYGVDPAFATADRPRYEGKAGLIATRLALSTATTLHRDWSLFTFARVDVVKGATNEASPLVRKSAGPSVGVGLAWTFWRSERSEE
jgi:MipA family protein